MGSALAFLAALLTVTAAARPALERPNLIVIFLDDGGYGDFSHTGNPSIHTPNISSLVRDGANFPQFYAASPACSASRYSLLTGRNPRRSGFGTWALSPHSTRHIHPSETTLAEGLSARGYATAMFGKWHLGNPNPGNSNTPNSLPLAHGFQRWLGTNVSNDYKPGANLMEGPAAANNPITGYNFISQDIATNIPIQEGLTKRYADATVDFIREKKAGPFFIYLAPNMPTCPPPSPSPVNHFPPAAPSMAAIYARCSIQPPSPAPSRTSNSSTPAAPTTKFTPSAKARGNSTSRSTPKPATTTASPPPLPPRSFSTSNRTPTNASTAIPMNLPASPNSKLSSTPSKTPSAPSKPSGASHQPVANTHPRTAKTLTRRLERHMKNQS
jgi:hypothetical protein